MAMADTLEAKRQARDVERGYRFDHKRVAMAYGIELIVIAASMVGAVYFARTYGHDDMWTMVVMLLAPVGYAVIEFCRVPLALSTRTQRNWLIKIAALLGLLCAAMVTVKSMSQLGYLMFQPRLEAVTKARRDHVALLAERADFQAKRDQAEKLVTLRREELDAAGERAQEATKGLTERPKAPPCVQTRRFDRRTQRWITGAVCPTETVAPMINARAVAAEQDRKDASVRYEEAQRTLASLDPKSFDDKVGAAEAAKKEAVFRSQLHTFTAMVYGKDPDEVSEGELHWFLRLFVFVPAVCVSFASTLLALTAVEKVRAPKQALIAEDAGAFLLGPLAQAVVNEANRTVERTAAAVIGKARTDAARGAASAAPPRRTFPDMDTDDKVVPLTAAE